MEKGTAQGGVLHDPESGVVLPPAGEELKAELKGGDHRIIPGARVLEWNVASVEVGRGKKSKLLLQNIAGKAKSGQLIALLGPSGSGKTTLLQSISLRSRAWSGALKYKGRVPGGDFFTASALVHQKEVIFGFMTPREHLLFQARARMSKKFSYDDIVKRVAEVMHEARLEKCADTIIGGTDLIYMRKGLSGGERKRLALATELLHCPEVIFLDEPSSGLDSVMAEAIVSLLRDMADRGRIVITCVHCPSSDLMRHFTDLLLLTHDGRLAYHGPKANAVPHFVGLGYAYPLDYNPADYLLKVLSYPNDGVKKVEGERVDSLVRAFAQSEWALTQPLRPTDAHKHVKRVKGMGANDWDMFVINCWRTTLQLYRDTVSLVLWGFTNTIMGLLFGTLFYQSAPLNWRNLMGLQYALATSTMMLGSMAMVVRFPLDWGPVVREYFAGSNAIGPYLLSRIVLLIPLSYGPVLMGTLIYWMTGMMASWSAFLLYIFVFVTVNWCSLALGHFASCISSNILVGLSVLPAMSTPMILFSGLLYQRGTVPSWLAWIESVSIVNYGFSAMLIQQTPILQDKSGNLVLKFIGIDPTSFWYDVGMLWVLFIIFCLATYASLVMRMRHTQDIS